MENAIAIVGLYAGLNTLILLWIAASTGQLRAKHKVFIGDGGVPHLTRILRGHANAMENVPMALILMLIMAGLHAPIYVLHGFGIVLTIGRFFHAMHFIKEDAPGWQRALGATTSLLLLAVGALGVIGHAAMLVF
jgi:uncharacterized membrane protein YecN with MAPEG domain